MQQKAMSTINNPKPPKNIYCVYKGQIFNFK